MKHHVNESIVLAALIVLALVGQAYAATAILEPKTTAQWTVVASPTTNTQTKPKVATVTPLATGTPVKRFPTPLRGSLRGASGRFASLRHIPRKESEKRP
jgi:hypothetical protein